MALLQRFRAAWQAFGEIPATRSAVWDAAGGGNRWANKTAPSTDFASITSPSVLRSRARDSYRNNPWARRAVEVVVAGAIGAGIKPQFRSANAELKTSVQSAWLAWTDHADFGSRFDVYGLQAAALRTMLVDGEVLVRMIVSPMERVPLQLQVLGAEFLDASRVDSRTINGIAYDSSGRRVAYWIFQKHPAEAPNMRSVRVPADQVLHLFQPLQPGQERGVSWLAPALLPLRELQEFAEAALVRQKVAALYAGFVRTPDGTNPLKPTSDVPTLEPGSMVRLQGGEEVEFSEPPEVGQQFEPFVRQQLRAIASALNIPYEFLSGDVSQVTFASGRHSILEFRRQLESIQHHLIVYQLCRPVWDAWIRFGIAAGVLPGQPTNYTDVRWVGPLPEMLDPKSEVAAIVSRVRAGFMSRSEAVSLTGLDAEQVDAETAADNARADRLGLVLDSDPRRVTQQGQGQQEVANDAK
ncbi:MAG: phage portal protein [Bryobacteraceae bacterium]